MKRHRAKEFLAFLRQIDRSTEADLDLHIILDNSSTHETPAVQKYLQKNPRFHLHFTPTSASWLNAVEGWFSQLAGRCMYRGVHTGVKELRDEIRRYIRAHDEECAKPFVWKKSAEKTLEKIERARDRKSRPNQPHETLARISHRPSRKGRALCYKCFDNRHLTAQRNAALENTL